ncbi:MAG TPA: SRPBCC domain-containing protein [Pyrinomonadaceae bacterium]|nr:SRPBCC domain-containing protein [Pyrinomonadaceae bacterium]
MKELFTDIEINAPAVAVWRALMDFQNYPNWNPFVRRIEGGAQVGDKLKIFLKPSGGGGITMTPKVVENKTNLEFAWLGHLFVSGLFDGRHSFRIEPAGENKVRFVQSERFTGILVPLLWLFIGKNTRRGFDEMNAALKKLLEDK